MFSFNEWIIYFKVIFKVYYLCQGDCVFEYFLRCHSDTNTAVRQVQDTLIIYPAIHQRTIFNFCETYTRLLWSVYFIHCQPDGSRTKQGAAVKTTTITKKGCVNQLWKQLRSVSLLSPFIHSFKYRYNYKKRFQCFEFMFSPVCLFIGGLVCYHINFFFFFTS